jgi:DNA-binding LytR/AlgR family response regulator
MSAELTPQPGWPPTAVIWVHLDTVLKFFVALTKTRPPVRALDRVRDQLAAMREAKPALSRLMAKAGDRVVFIKAGHIEWIESASNYVIVRAGSERHIIRETMATLEAELPGGDFVRLNHGLIVNLRTIVELKE